MSEDEAKPVKTVLIGEAGVGKTCIISRFVNNIYDDNTMSNINPAFSAKTMKFNAFGGKELRYDLWDTAGQEKYKSIAKFLYKDAQVIIFVYDITRIDSFDEIKNYWYKEVKENCNKGVILGLVGNKCDLFEREKVTEKQGKELATEMGAVFRLTSPKEKVGINELFQDIGCKVLGNVVPNNKGNQEESSLFNTMMGDFEIIDKKNIKLEEYNVKEVEIKKSC